MYSVHTHNPYKKYEGWSMTGLMTCETKERFSISSVILGGSNRGEICGYGEIRSLQSQN